MHRYMPDYMVALERHFDRLDNYLEDLYMRCEDAGVHPDKCREITATRNAMEVAEHYTGEARLAYWVARVFKG